MNKYEARDNLMHLLKETSSAESKLKIQELFGYIDQTYGETSFYAGALQKTEQLLEETDLALIDIWKAFCSPTTKEQQMGAMEKHDAVLQRIIAKKRIET